MRFLSWTIFQETICSRDLPCFFKCLFKKEQLVLYRVPPIIPIVSSRSFNIIMWDVCFHKFFMQCFTHVRNKILRTAVDDDVKSGFGKLVYHVEHRPILIETRICFNISEHSIYSISFRNNTDIERPAHTSARPKNCWMPQCDKHRSMSSHT